tara:strand:+ start:4650 stop:5156 length:507 start_codon:yes stop_codon:yes gene_type:complete
MSFSKVTGLVVHDTPVTSAGAPIVMGAATETAQNSTPANQVDTEGDVARVLADLDGTLYTRGHPPRIWLVNTEVVSAQTNFVLVAPPGSGHSIYVTDAHFSCASGAGSQIITIKGSTNFPVIRTYGNSSPGYNTNLTTPLKLLPNQTLTVTTTQDVTTFITMAGFIAP